MARVAVGLFGCPPPSGCACGGAFAGWHGRLRAHASSSDSPWLSERSAPARSEFHGAPRKRPAAGLPRRGRRLQGRLSFGYFSLAKQRTSTSPAGARPGLRPQKRHSINYKNNSYQRLPQKRQRLKTPNPNFTPAQSPPDTPAPPSGEKPSACAPPLPPTGCPRPPTSPCQQEKRCCRSSNTSR